MKNLKGFTLLEVLVTSLLVAFLGAGTVYTLALSNRVLNMSIKQAMVNSNTQRIMDQIANDVRGGFKLEATSENVLIITSPDKPQITWKCEDNKLIRESNGDKSEILLFGGDPDKNLLEVTFTSEILTSYYQTDVKMKMTLYDSNSFSADSLQNRYYCKLEM
jgi:prepilin-type N-terminal cleavage/methylation domain-containing protein